MMEPFIPGFSGKIYNQINLEKEYEQNQDLLGKIYGNEQKVSYGLSLLKPGHKLNEVYPIFKEMKDDLINEFKMK